MGRRSDHSREELQAMIIEATLTLVRDRGADKVTARQIATAVGYTPGMLYSVFINLQDIFLHVNEIGLRTLHALCAEAVSENATPEEAIKAMGLAYLRFAGTHTHQFDLMFTRSIQQPEMPPPGLDNQIRTLFELVEFQLRRLNASATDEEVHLGARALWSGVHGTAALRLSDQLYLDAPDADRDIVELLVTSFVQYWRA
ncbi:MAG: TetR/AcrR family transcriptional regulator [Granulosicoccus sp.]|nr:TetR/AcrR family transcriptional regulator [Granulosicoccus sp.]